MGTRHSFAFTASDKRMLREGRGQGRGADYLPWLEVRDVPSKGRSSRPKGWITGRVHQVLSGVEDDYLAILDWTEVVEDIREQFPLLPLDETIALAKQSGVTHPTEPGTQQPKVMTTDFLVTVRYPGGHADVARSVKKSADLVSDRTLQKLEIERLYWKARNVDWGLVTEREYSPVLARNLEKVREPWHLATYTSLTRAEVDDCATLLTDLVESTNLPLSRVATECDHRLGLELGTSLVVAYYLIATRQWRIDMDRPLDPARQLALQGHAFA